MAKLWLFVNWCLFKIVAWLKPALLWAHYCGASVMLREGPPTSTEKKNGMILPSTWWSREYAYVQLVCV